MISISYKWKLVANKDTMMRKTNHSVRDPTEPISWKTGSRPGTTVGMGPTELVPVGRGTAAVCLKLFIVQCGDLLPGSFTTDRAINRVYQLRDF